MRANGPRREAEKPGRERQCRDDEPDDQEDERQKERHENDEDDDRHSSYSDSGDDAGHIVAVDADAR
jgi:hypothetical protein